MKDINITSKGNPSNSHALGPRGDSPYRGDPGGKAPDFACLVHAPYYCTCALMNCRWTDWASKGGLLPE